MAEITTSERVSMAGAASTAEDYFIFLEHLATYNFAKPYAAGNDVLDFGCGTGYGTASISKTARSIVGVDIAAEAVEAARRDFLNEGSSDRLAYRMISPVERAPLPFDDDSFDTVLSFQVIEHVHDVDAYLREVRRVLRPSGTFVCATPDRRTRLFRHQRPFNRFHLQEWAPEEFARLLSGVFAQTQVFGMTASPHALSGELKRCRTASIVTYPFTFPGAPEKWRQAGLRGLKKVRAARSAGASADTNLQSAEVRYGFGLKDVWIAPDAWPSLNVVTVSS